MLDSVLRPFRICSNCSRCKTLLPIRYKAILHSDFCFICGNTLGGLRRLHFVQKAATPEEHCSLQFRAALCNPLFPGTLILRLVT
ncbi:hypothetical protein M404DRAFT_427172 [Pisolithus tinctorius Marx 270]|uniref:Uncharacterized protein n=1 Tax=Pisolithus tinctorius Marx 270 TaxID=870435 RepID=A0A0C3PGH6_PISTI|nr:hypothetical protein M404DRAFT_427172 [Pisolithus tinctorius Marx 270]